MPMTDEQRQEDDEVIDAMIDSLEAQILNRGTSC